MRCRYINHKRPLNVYACCGTITEFQVSKIEDVAAAVTDTSRIRTCAPKGKQIIVAHGCSFESVAVTTWL